jgi:hypothetical protein
VWHVKEPLLLKAVSAKHRSKCSPVTGIGDSRQIAEILLVRLKTKQTILPWMQYRIFTLFLVIYSHSHISTICKVSNIAAFLGCNFQSFIRVTKSLCVPICWSCQGKILISYGTNFEWCTISTNYVSSVMLRPKKKIGNPTYCENCKEQGKNPRNRVPWNGAKSV